MHLRRVGHTHLTRAITRRGMVSSGLALCIAAGGCQSDDRNNGLKSGDVFVGQKTGALSLRDELGREIRLAGLAAPDAQLGWVGAELQRELHGAVAQLASGRPLSVTWRGEGRSDRWGRLACIAMAKGDELSVQELLLMRGLAYFAPEPTTRTMSQRLAACEARARHAKLGLWSGAGPGMRSPQCVDDLNGQFIVVQGRVTEVELRRRRRIVRFAPRRWGGLSLESPRSAQERIPDDRLLGLRDRVVRVRGRVEEGRAPWAPHITASEAAQIADVF